jgi:hypothetical protein
MPRHTGKTESKLMPTETRKTIRGLVDELPWWLRGIWNFLVPDGKSLRRGFLAYLIITGAIAWLSFQYGRGASEGDLRQVRAELTTVDQKASNLKHDNDLLAQRNTDLQVTIAPLLARAAREFPGEEINHSLKKIIGDLEAKKPANEPLLSATATITVDVLSERKTDGAGLLAGAALNLIRDRLFSKRQLALAIYTRNHQIKNIEPGKVRYTFICDQLVPESTFINEPVATLLETSFIQLEFTDSLIPEGTVIDRGDIVLVVNNRVSMRFQIPPQTLRAPTDAGSSHATIGFVYDLKDGLAPLE